MGEKYIHKKTGNIYYVTARGVINCTNENDGQIMIMYENESHIFVREEKEFLEKFTPYKEI